MKIIICLVDDRVTGWFKCPARLTSQPLALKLNTDLLGEVVETGQTGRRS